MDFSHDEEYLRSYYLNCPQNNKRETFEELKYLFPALLMAFFSWNISDITWLVTGFVYLIVVFIYRTSSSRWKVAYVGLIRKYEAELQRLRTQIEDQT